MSTKFSKKRWLQIQKILDQVLDLPKHQQLGYLENHCGQDLELYRDLKDLLACSEAAPTFLERPAVALTPTEVFSTSSAESQASNGPNFYKHRHIGPFLLQEEIGRGGMGVVYRAERTDGAFEQQVAIKLLWNWENHGSASERFKREQQLLASLSHPGIAQIYDGGITEDGQPYFVMEYLAGTPINHYCLEHGLSIEEKLNLILHVADALQFAHKNLIVHRDIKPSNILVTKNAQVKLLDFGVAKLLSEQALNELTQVGEHILTPGYAAPEQLRNENITVATDIYQLGLVLYELLTGVNAYRDQATSFVELANAICECEPTRPSDIVISSATNMGIAEGPNAKRLQKKLKGDLDAIVLKMLRNNASHRYESMEAFKSDLLAYFHQRPIAAQEQRFIYKVHKFIFRNWKSVSAGTLFVLMLFVYAITVTLQSEKIRSALDRSVLEKRKAEQVSDFMINIFKAADPNVSGLKKLTADELLGQGHQKIISELDNNPVIQGHMLSALGEIYFSQGDLEKSLVLMEQSLAILKKKGNNDALLAAVLVKLASMYLRKSEFDLAKTHLDEAFARYKKRKTRYAESDSVAYADALNTYGDYWRSNGDFQKADKNYSAAIGILREREGQGRQLLGVALNNLSVLQSTHGHFVEAIVNMREALQIHEDVLGEKHSYFSLYLVNASFTLIDMEEYEEAERYSLRALQIQKDILNPSHPYLSTTFRALGLLYHRQGDLYRAEDYFRKSLAIMEAYAGSESYFVGVIHLLLGSVFKDQGRYDEAELAYDKMLSVFYKLDVSDDVIGRGLCQLASLKSIAGNLDEAKMHYQSAIERLSNSPARATMAQLGYAQVLIEFGELDAAKILTESAYDYRSSQYPSHFGLVAEAQAITGLVLAKQQDFDRAKPLLNMAVEILAKKPLYHYGGEKSIYFRALSQLSELEARSRHEP